MQSSGHVENANGGKIVYLSHTTPSVSYRVTISLNGTMLTKFSEVTIIHQVPPHHQLFLVF